MVGVAQTVGKAIDSLNAIMKLKQDCESQILTLGRKAPNAKRMLDNLFAQPVVTAADVASQPGVSTVTANALLADFERLGIVKEATGFKRNRLFLFDAYLEIFHR